MLRPLHRRDQPVSVHTLTQILTLMASVLGVIPPSAQYFAMREKVALAPEPVLQRPSGELRVTSKSFSACCPIMNTMVFCRRRPVERFVYPSGPRSSHPGTCRPDDGAGSTMHREHRATKIGHYGHRLRKPFPQSGIPRQTSDVLHDATFKQEMTCPGSLDINLAILILRCHGADSVFCQ